MGLEIRLLRLYCIYVTGKLCNQSFRKMLKDSRHFLKSLIYLGIQAFHVMPGFELQAFREMPKSDAPNIFRLSSVTVGS